MALQCDPPHLGDIGEPEEECEEDPDAVYEKEIEKRMEREE